VALLKFGFRNSLQGGRYGRGTLLFAGGAGFLTTALGIILAFSPAKQITSLWKYEAGMFGITLGFLALGTFFFFGYGRFKRPDKVHVKTADASRPGGAELS